MGIRIGNTVIAPDEAPADGGTYARKDAAWIDIEEAANLQVRRGTAAEVAAITPLDGEPVWDGENDVLFVGDGSTQGGVAVGHSLLDEYGGKLALKVVAAEKTFAQQEYQGVSDGEIGLAIPANSLVLGASYRLGSGGLDDGGQLNGFAIGWSGDTDALFSSQTASANGSGVQMLATPVWLSAETEVSLEPPSGSALGMSGTIRVAVYYYAITAMSTF